MSEYLIGIDYGGPGGRAEVVVLTGGEAQGWTLAKLRTPTRGPGGWYTHSFTLRSHEPTRRQRIAARRRLRRAKRGWR
jgi:hypothetical protein